MTQPELAPARKVGVCFRRQEGLPGGGKTVLEGGKELGRVGGVVVAMEGKCMLVKWSLS